MKIAIIGFGDLGIYIRDTLQDFHEIKEPDFAFFDDKFAASGHPNAFPFSEYKNERFSDHNFHLGLGYRHLKLKNQIIAELVGMGRKLPVFIHPSAYVHPSVKIGSGSFIYPGCSIDRSTVIGTGVWIANASVIPHDCLIDDGCWFGANVVLSGKVRVGKNSFIGSGTTVSNDITISDNVIVGLGSVITKNIAEGLSVIGNPMRILENKINLV
ncbi:MAG: acetyltransferase [Ferruginibacter sp.]